MNQAFNTAWIGFGWGQDVSVEGGTASDVYTLTVHRARPGGGSFAWTGAPDPDGVLRVRVNGQETATWTAGVLPVSIRIQRGGAAGIVADLPPLVVKMSAVLADGNEPLISDRSKPLALQLTGSDGGQIAVRLEVGIKGDKGDKGDIGDVTPELMAARDAAVASANSSSADAFATAADRAATAQDRAQVRADQIEVADDRARTAADRAATGADRMQTIQDRTAVVASRDETEILRDSASGHRATAQEAATASQANRDATAAERVQTGQDRASATASAQTASDNATQTTDDRVQTGQDRQAAANSAAAAATFNPALYARLDGATYTGNVVLRANVPRLLATRPSDGATQWDLLSTAVREARLRVFDPDQPGALSVLVLTYAGSAVWDGFEMWTAKNAPDATDPEADAGTGTVRRMWSAARIWRAARAALPLVTQTLAEAGTDGVARSWSVLRVWQAIRAALPAMTQAVAEAGADTVARSVSALTLRQAAIAADPEVLIYSWNASDLSGLTQITRDLPTGYSSFILRECDVRLTSGSGGLSLRIGPVAGGGVDSGASDYNNVAATATTGWTNSRLDADVAFIRQLSTGPGQSDVEFTTGADASWSFKAFAGVFVGSNSFDLRYGTRNAAAYVVRRLQIGFGGVLAASGSLRLYGVK